MEKNEDMYMDYFKEIYSRNYKNNQNRVKFYCINTFLMYCQTCITVLLFILGRQCFCFKLTLSQWDQFNLILRKVYDLKFYFPLIVIYPSERETLM